MKMYNEVLPAQTGAFVPMSDMLLEPSTVQSAQRHDHDHGHGHGHHERSQSTLGKAIKWVTVLGNGAVGAAEIAIAKLNTLSVIIDGVHNIGDFVSYWLQFNTVFKGHLLSPEEIKSRRRLAYAVIAGASLLGAGHAVQEAFDNERETAYSGAAVYAAAASVALNGSILAGMQVRANRQRERDILNGGPVCAHNHTAEHDIRKHLLYADVPSAVLAFGGAMAQRHGVDLDISTYEIPVDQVAAAVSGVVGAIAFRPTTRNLDDPCASAKL